MLGDKQWAYNDWLADACGDVARLPGWRPLMYKVAGQQALREPIVMHVHESWKLLTRCWPGRVHHST